MRDGVAFVSSEGVVELAGFDVPDEHVLGLAGLLADAGYDETAERLTYALKWGMIASGSGSPNGSRSSTCSTTPPRA